MNFYYSTKSGELKLKIHFPKKCEKVETMYSDSELDYHYSPR